jgi:hypothetical protein
LICAPVQVESVIPAGMRQGYSDMLPTDDATFNGLIQLIRYTKIYGGLP